MIHVRLTDELHKKLKVTVVYVTHDQAEAMVISDRIVLMQNQEIAQIGTAEEVYRKPVNRFVADFVGVANFIDSTVREVNRDRGRVKVSLDSSREKVLLDCLLPGSGEHVKENDSGSFFVRPEDIELTSGQAGNLTGTVKLRTFLGDSIDYRIQSEGIEWRVKSNPEVTYSEDEDVGMKINRAVFLPA